MVLRSRNFLSATKSISPPYRNSRPTQQKRWPECSRTDTSIRQSGPQAWALQCV